MIVNNPNRQVGPLDGRRRQHAELGQDRGGQLHQEPEPPDPVAGRLGDEQGRGPDQGAREETGDVPGGHRSGLLHAAPRPGPQADEQHPQRHVGGGEAGGAAVQGTRDAHRQRDRAQHGRQHRHPVQRPVDVEQIAVVGEVAPHQPHRQRQQDEPENARQGQVVVQVVRQRGDGEDEDQIEEQLQPGGVPLALAGGVQGEPGRAPAPSPIAGAVMCAQPPGDRSS
jgi:hypothetical protein